MDFLTVTLPEYSTDLSSPICKIEGVGLDEFSI